jgi:hypothetical protein
MAMVWRRGGVLIRGRPDVVLRGGPIADDFTEDHAPDMSDGLGSDELFVIFRVPVGVVVSSTVDGEGDFLPARRQRAVGAHHGDVTAA